MLRLAFSRSANRDQFQSFDPSMQRCDPAYRLSRIRQFLPATFVLPFPVTRNRLSAKVHALKPYTTADLHGPPVSMRWQGRTSGRRHCALKLTIWISASGLTASATRDIDVALIVAA